MKLEEARRRADAHAGTWGGQWRVAADHKAKKLYIQPAEVPTDKEVLYTTLPEIEYVRPDKS